MEKGDLAPTEQFALVQEFIRVARKLKLHSVRLIDIDSEVKNNFKDKYCKAKSSSQVFY